MVIRKNRIPKNGDHVTARGETDTFVIYGVERSLQTALTLIGGDLGLSSMAWDALSFLDKEDASRAAARIVKKATDKP